MEKLEKIFEEKDIKFWKDKKTGSKEYYEDCALEVQKIAIEFLTWVREYEGDSELSKIYRLELFNKFIEEYEG